MHDTLQHTLGPAQAATASECGTEATAVARMEYIEMRRRTGEARTQGTIESRGIPAHLAGKPAEAPVFVVSPHLDDAALSCGRLLDARPGSTVLTVFAGGRRDWSYVTPWDSTCGFTAGQDVLAVRRKEDERALAMLGALPDWMDLPQDGDRHDDADLVELTDEIRRRIEDISPMLVAAPLGLRHVDHIIVSDATIGALRELGLERWVVYAELYAHTHPHLVVSRLADLAARGIELRETVVPQGKLSAKRKALRLYETQRRGLGANVVRKAARAPERFWTHADV